MLIVYHNFEAVYVNIFAQTGPFYNNDITNAHIEKADYLSD